MLENYSHFGEVFLVVFKAVVAIILWGAGATG